MNRREHSVSPLLDYTRSARSDNFFGRVFDSRHIHKMPIKNRGDRLAYQRAYQRAWKAARRAAWLAGKVCAHCGATENLEIDHIDPAAKVSHKIWSWAPERREAELAKCQVLCKRCHRLKTSAARPLVMHGTNTCYTNRRCRCDLCKRAHAQANAKYRSPKSRMVWRRLPAAQ